MKKTNIKSYRTISKKSMLILAALCLLCSCGGKDRDQTAAGTITEVSGTVAEDPGTVSEAQQEADVCVLTVDGYPVSRREFMMFLREERALTAQHFHEAYGAESGPDFWNTEYDGQTPLEYCREKAVEAVVRYKQERILACERGLVEAVDYADLMADMKELNEENARRKERGEAVYGLSEFEPQQYLHYLRSDCEAKLHTDAVKRMESEVSEERLKERYEAEKEAYHLGWNVVCERLDVPEGMSESELEDVLKQVAAQASAAGESLEEAASELGNLKDYTVSQAVSTEMTVGKDDFREQEILSRMFELEPGEISEPLDTSGGGGCLLRCLERTERGYLSFEDSKPMLLEEFAQESLEELLEQRSSAAVIEYQEGYEDITLE